MRKIAFLIILMVTANQLNAQSTLVGKWEGGIMVPGGQLKIVFNIDGPTDKLFGTLDIPQQGARGLRFNSVTQKEDSVELIFSAGQVKGVFTGIIENESSISGIFSQGAGETPFKVERIQIDNSEENELENETEIVLTNRDIEIGGTLTLPKGEIKAPLLIMSSGSGAQDRDSNIFDFKIFKEIAQALAKQGIPSFRYDDRGINKSSGNFAETTLDDLVSDVDAIINYFKNSNAQNFDKFTILGHSQGGVVAGKVARENESVVQLILMGSTAPSLSEILRYQVELAYQNSPVNKSLIEIEIVARESLMRSLVNDENIEDAKLAFEQAYIDVLNDLPDVQRKSIPDINGMAQNQVSSLVAAYSSAQMKSLLFYVPTSDLEKIEIPVLVLFGGKDTQVTISQNLEPMKEALESSGTSFEIMTFPEANHLFQKAETGAVNEYPFLAKDFVDGFLEQISSWILQNIN